MSTSGSRPGWSGSVRHGRVWWGARRSELVVEWCLGRTRLALSWERGAGDGTRSDLGVELLVVALWVSVTRWGHYPARREWFLAVYGGALWWAWGAHPVLCDPVADGRRRGRLQVVDWLLGELEYRVESGPEVRVVVPLVERGYPARAQTLQVVNWRARWPWRRRFARVDLEIDGEGLPVAADGSRWTAWSGPAESVEAAIRQCVTDVERVRSSRAVRQSWGA